MQAQERTPTRTRSSAVTNRGGRTGWLIGVLALALLTAAAPAQAKDPAGAGHASTVAKRKEIQARLKTWLSSVLRRDIGLEEQKALAVEQTLERTRQARKPLQKELKAQRQTLALLLEQGSTDQAAYDRALTALRSSTAQIEALKLKELDDLRKLLTPKQTAALLRAVVQLKAKMKAELGASDDGWGIDE